jgi:3-hydroxyisobutyrate dehydrogenase
MMSNGKPRVGFIGLGLMGAGMARNIARAGFPLTVYNRTRLRSEELVAEFGGVTVADSPRHAAESADVLVSIVSDVPDVEAIYLGTDGVIEAAHSGLTCVDMGTVGADCASRVAAALAKKGAEFVDAPVSGGVWGAKEGTLSIMAGGSAAAYAAALPVFEAMGKKIVHCGPVGSGQQTKLVNQIVVALNLEAVAEGLLFAQKAGLNIQTTLDAVGAGAASSWAWNTLGPRMASGDYEPGFKIAHQIKDLRLAIEAAEKAGISLRGARLVMENLQRAQEILPDGGERGTQGIIAAL